MARKTLYCCDGCKTNIESYDLPIDWNEICYSYKSVLNGERKILSYEVCSPECYIIMVDRMIEWSDHHNHQETYVDNMMLSFARRMLEYIKIRSSSKTALPRFEVFDNKVVVNNNKKAKKISNIEDYVPKEYTTEISWIKKAAIVLRDLRKPMSIKEIMAECCVRQDITQDGIKKAITTLSVAMRSYVNKGIFSCELSGKKNIYKYIYEQEQEALQPIIKTFEQAKEANIDSEDVEVVVEEKYSNDFERLEGLRRTELDKRYSESVDLVPFERKPTPVLKNSIHKAKSTFDNKPFEENDWLGRLIKAHKATLMLRNKDKRKLYMLIYRRLLNGKWNELVLLLKYYPNFYEDMMKILPEDYKRSDLPKRKYSKKSELNELFKQQEVSKIKPVNNTNESFDVLEISVESKERLMWIEEFALVNKSNAAMEAMEDMFNVERRYDSGLLEKQFPPTTPLLRYDKGYIIFIPANKKQSFDNQRDINASKQNNL